jgi:hypothetical protein
MCNLESVAESQTNTTYNTSIDPAVLVCPVCDN